MIPPRFELGLQESEACVLTTILWDHSVLLLVLIQGHPGYEPGALPLS